MLTTFFCCPPTDFIQTVTSQTVQRFEFRPGRDLSQVTFHTAFDLTGVFLISLCHSAPVNYKCPSLAPSFWLNFEVNISFIHFPFPQNCQTLPIRNSILNSLLLFFKSRKLFISIYTYHTYNFDTIICGCGGLDSIGGLIARCVERTARIGKVLDSIIEFAAAFFLLNLEVVRPWEVSNQQVGTWWF